VDGDMGDHEVAALCLEKFRQLDEHIAQSPDFRDKVVLHAAQIQTLKEAQEFNMEKIASIENNIELIKKDISGIQTWILVGVISFCLSIAGSAAAFIYSYGTLNKEVSINTQRWNNLIAGEKVR
jgi:hypothetical protein